GRDLLIGRVEVLTSGDDESETAPPARIGGGAVFRGDRMVGWVDEGDIMGWFYATGRADHTTLTIQAPGDDIPVSVDISRMISEMRPAADDGEVRVELRVRAEGSIQNFPTAGDLETGGGFIESLERRLAEAIRSRIETAIASSQRFNSDIIGFGNLIHRKRPKTWDSIGGLWDEILPQLVVNVTVNAEIVRTGLSSSPAHGGGK
ncbi:MAG: Ger(x)C family spore germination C-terminal domain-containing protein, partial [Bacillota bacterium]